MLAIDGAVLNAVTAGKGELQISVCCAAHFPLFFSPGTDQASPYRQSTNDFTAPSMPATFGLFDSIT